MATQSDQDFKRATGPEQCQRSHTQIVCHFIWIVPWMVPLAGHPNFPLAALVGPDGHYTWVPQAQWTATARVWRRSEPSPAAANPHAGGTKNPRWHSHEEWPTNGHISRISQVNHGESSEQLGHCPWRTVIQILGTVKVKDWPATILGSGPKSQRLLDHQRSPDSLRVNLNIYWPSVGPRGYPTGVGRGHWPTQLPPISGCSRGHPTRSWQNWKHPRVPNPFWQPK